MRQTLMRAASELALSPRRSTIAYLIARASLGDCHADVAREDWDLLAKN